MQYILSKTFMMDFIPIEKAYGPPERIFSYRRIEFSSVPDP
jgi:hypothetical protein